METPIIVAIISGVFGIVSPITAYVVTRIYDRRVLGKIVGRRKALIGKWKGNIVQDSDRELGEMGIDMVFTSSGKVIEGDCEFIFPEGNRVRVIKLKFIGGFYHERFVKFDYTNPEDGVIQFGCAIMILASEGKRLEGRYVGYGSITNRIVSGTVVMHKTP
jgi:hypothetical protein